MKTILIMPPQYDPTSPSLALPCLTAVLQEAGFEVIQKDLNIEFLDLVLSKAGIENAYQNFCARRLSLQFLRALPESIDNIIARKDFLMNEIEAAKKVLRSPEDFYDYQKLISSLKLIEESFQFISLGYFRTNLTLNSYSTIYSVEATEQIMKAIKDEFCNPYIDFYARYSIPEIESMAPQVVGISISVAAQIIPGFTLAYMIKQVSKDIHLVLGGSYFSFFKDTLGENQLLFSIFDSVIIDEGETALVELLTCLEQGTSLKKVPNLIFRDGSRIFRNDILHNENIDELPTPSFEGLPLHLYFSPRLIFPFYISRGCYWGKCAFCIHDPYFGSRYRQRSVAKVLEDIKNLKDRYGCDTFGFVDAALPPDLLNKISDEIIQSGLQINWLSYARFEKQIDRELCEKLVKSGCRILVFGLESACERILLLIEKGTDIGIINEVLRASSQAGIANIVTCICGFPTETSYETDETMQFILDNRSHIAQISLGFFVLYRNSKVFLNPKNYMIKESLHPEGHDLSLTYDYRLEQGLSQKEAESIVNMFLESWSKSAINFLNHWSLFNLYVIYYQTNNLSEFINPSKGQF